MLTVISLSFVGIWVTVSDCRQHRIPNAGLIVATAGILLWRGIGGDLGLDSSAEESWPFWPRYLRCGPPSAGAILSIGWFSESPWEPSRRVRFGRWSPWLC